MGKSQTNTSKTQTNTSKTQTNTSETQKESNDLSICMGKIAEINIIKEICNSYFYYISNIKKCAEKAICIQNSIKTIDEKIQRTEADISNEKKKTLEYNKTQLNKEKDDNNANITGLLGLYKSKTENLRNSIGTVKKEIDSGCKLDINQLLEINDLKFDPNKDNYENLIKKLEDIESVRKVIYLQISKLSGHFEQQYLKKNIKALKKQRRCIIGRQILLFILLVLPGFLFFFTDNQCKTTIQITKNNTVCNCCDIKSNNCKHCNACPHCHMFDFICDFVCDNHNTCRSNKCICCPHNNKCSYEICETNSKHSLCRWQKFVIVVWIIILVCIIVWCIFRLPSLYRKYKRIDAIITKINTGYYRSIEEFRRDLDSALKQ